MKGSRLRAFGKDTAGATATTVLTILLVVLIPIALFVLLFQYLKRATPEGAILAGGSSAGQTTFEDDPNAPIEGARKCRRCQNMVRPYKTSHGPECPNCGAGMGG